MNDNNDINQIRELLERYYRAATTPEEEKHIERYFLETDVADIPADMQGDSKLFVGLSAIRPLSSELEAPCDLLGRIEKIAGEPTIARTAPKRILQHWVIRAAGFTCAACVACAIIMMVARLSDNTISDSGNLTAEASIGKENDTRVLTIQKSGYDTTEVTQGIKIKEEARPITRPKASKPQRKITEEDDGFVEITDPAEAQKIAQEIGRLLAMNADKSYDAMNQISETFDSYKEITKNILQ